MKTLVIAVAVMMLLWATLCIAQDQSLGDVARPGYDHEGVNTYTRWNVMREPPLPPEIY